MPLRPQPITFPCDHEREAERRRFSRVPVLFDVEYAYPAKKVFISGLVYNSSRAGLLLGSDFPFTPGERVRIRVTGPRTCFPRRAALLVAGCVCWTSLRVPPGHLPVHEAGIRFHKCIDPQKSPGLRCLLPSAG